MNGALKLDIVLSDLERCEKIPLELSTGDAINVSIVDGDIVCTVADGVCIGSVPATEAASRLGSGVLFGRVRTVRREPSSNTITSLQVRISHTCPKAINSLEIVEEIPGQVHIVDEEVLALSRDQCLNLASNDEVRRYLRDERLQECLMDIDSATDRKAVLKRALESPSFKEFCDKVLHVVAPAQE